MPSQDRPLIRIAHRIEIQGTQEEIFDAIADHEGLSAWFLPRARVTLIKTGDGDRNGLGAIREIGNGPFVGHEEVVRYEHPDLLHYRVIKGLPMRRHLGVINVRPLRSGTVELTWEVEFEATIWGIGWVLRAVVDGALKSGLARLPAHLEALRRA